MSKAKAVAPQAKAKSSQARRALTPPGLLSFPHIFTPQVFAGKDGEPDGDPKYGGVLVWTPEMKADLSKLKAIVQVAGIEKFGKEQFAKLLKAGKIRLPFRNGDEDDVQRYPEGSVYINAKSDNQPQVVGRYKDPATGKAQRITDPEELYPGAVVIFSVTAFGYDVRGNKGIAFALNNVQKYADGPRLDSRVAAEDEFDAEEPAVADLSDLDPEEADARDGGDDVSTEDLTDLM